MLSTDRTGCSSYEKLKRGEYEHESHEGMLHKIEDWRLKESSSNLLFVIGNSGTGKSVLLAEFVGRLRDAKESEEKRTSQRKPNHRLSPATSAITTHFLYRFDPGDCSIHSVIVSIASQIAQSNKEFAKAVNLNNPDRSSNSSIEDFFHDWIADPYKKVIHDDRATRCLVVIDGLDNGVIPKNDVDEFFQTIAKWLSTKRERPLNIHFILSCAERDILCTEEFDEFDLITMTARSHSGDIAAYLQANVRDYVGDDQLLKKVVKKVGRSFDFATHTLYLLKGRYELKGRLLQDKDLKRVLTAVPFFHRWRKMEKAMKCENFDLSYIPACLYAAKQLLSGPVFQEILKVDTRKFRQILRILDGLLAKGDDNCIYITNTGFARWIETDLAENPDTTLMGHDLLAEWTQKNPRSSYSREYGRYHSRKKNFGSILESNNDCDLIVALHEELLAIGDSSGRITLHDRFWGSLLVELSKPRELAPGGVSALVFYKNYLVSGSAEGIWQVFDLKSLGLKYTFETPAPRQNPQVVVNSSGLMVAAIGEDAAYVWDLNTGCKIRELRPYGRGGQEVQAGRTCSVAIDEEIIAVGFQHGQVFIYSCKDFLQKARIGSPTHHKKITSIALHGAILVTGTNTGVLNMWNLPNPLRGLPNGGRNPYDKLHAMTGGSSIDFLLNLEAGKLVAASRKGNVVHVACDSLSGLSQIPGDSRLSQIKESISSITADSLSLVCACLGPNNLLIIEDVDDKVTSTPSDGLGSHGSFPEGSIRHYIIKARDRMRRVSNESKGSHTSEGLPPAFDVMRHNFEKKSIKFTQSRLGLWKGCNDSLGSIVVMNDHFIVTGGSAGIINVYDKMCDTRKSIKSPNVRTVSMCLCGDYLVSVDNDSVVFICHLPTSKTAITLECPGVHCIASNDSAFALASQQKVQLWNLPEEEDLPPACFLELKFTSNVTALDMSDRFLAVGLNSGTLEIHTLDKILHERATVRPNDSLTPAKVDFQLKGQISAIALDNERVAAVANDNFTSKSCVCVWNCVDCTEIYNFRTQKLTTIRSLSLQDNNVFTAGSSGVRCWDLRACNETTEDSSLRWTYGMDITSFCANKSEFVFGLADDAVFFIPKNLERKDARFFMNHHLNEKDQEKMGGFIHEILNTPLKLKDKTDYKKSKQTKKEKNDVKGNRISRLFFKGKNKIEKLKENMINIG